MTTTRTWMPAILAVAALCAAAAPGETTPAERRILRSAIPVSWWSSGYASFEDGVSWAIVSDTVERRSGATRQRFAPAIPRLFGLHFTSPREGWAVGDHGVAVRTRDGGASWSASPTGVTDALHAITCLPSGRCWAVGDAHVLETPSGVDWKVTALPVPEDRALEDVFFLDESNGWVIGQRIAFSTRDGGRTWSRFDSGDFHGRGHLVRFRTRSEGFVASGNGLEKTTDGGQTWRSVLTLPSALQVDGLGWAGDRVFVSVKGEHPAFVRFATSYRSDDRGETWSELAQPAEARVDWAAIHDRASPGPLRRVVVGAAGDVSSVVDARVSAAGAVVDTVLVAPARNPDGYPFQQAAARTDRALSLADWSRAIDPCLLDPAGVERAIEPLVDPEWSAWRIPEWTVVAECGATTKRFALRPVPRRALARHAPRLARLYELVDRVSTAAAGLSQDAAARSAGGSAVARLRSGSHDFAFADVKRWRRMLAEEPRVAAPPTPGVWTEPCGGDDPRPTVHAVPAYPPGTVRWQRAVVRLNARVDPKTGAVTQVDLPQLPSRLQQAAGEAMRRWRFDPSDLRAETVCTIVHFHDAGGATP
jgi:photosystem II stability/assembly factor-like uncharacterized protein